MAANTTAIICRQDLQDLTLPAEAFVTDVKHLGSYNWLESSEPTIAVPGSPPLWSPPSGPCQVQKDSGHVFIDQNAACHPESPLEPLFRALYITHPSFDMRSVDLITDRNSIRKLLSVVNLELSDRGLQPFTINVELAGNTVILARDQPLTEEHIGPLDFKGYGREFEKACTRDGVSGSTGHYRIVSYRFGHMKFIIRHETDGFVDADLKTHPADHQNRENDTLSSNPAPLSLYSTKKPQEFARDGSKLRIIEEGFVVPGHSTLEIKTRVVAKPIEFTEVAAQLWVSQTPKLVRAYHNWGMFQEPVVEDVTEDIKTWELANQKDLRRFAALIQEILQIARDIGGRMVIKYDQTTGNVVIQKVDRKKMLPEDVYHHWDDKGNVGL